MPETIIVYFETYNGPQFFNDPLKKNWIPINPSEAYSKSINCTRNQFPMRLNYACTIHKSQGQTIKRAIVCLGDKEASFGSAFVACSRFANINDVLFEQFFYERLTCIRNSTCLKPRMEEEHKARRQTRKRTRETA